MNINNEVNPSRENIINWSLKGVSSLIPYLFRKILPKWKRDNIIKKINHEEDPKPPSNESIINS